MGLFSTLSSTTINQLPTVGTDAVADPATVSTQTASSSATLPTVIQLYTHRPILLEDTPHVTGYTTMTYQAVQVGASQDDVELKNRHYNPDLGVWNCHVKASRVGNNNKHHPLPLVHSLLAKVAPQASTYCMTIDLTDETQVEPNMSLLQSTLVRHLIEHPTPHDDPESPQNTKTTSLYDLQAVQFGLASEDRTTEQSIDEEAKKVKISLMICAVLPLETQEVSESAYKQKQARALIIYHLRKFANAVNAALCFVQDKTSGMSSVDHPPPSSPSKQAETLEGTADAAASSMADDAQPAVSYETLSQLWRDLAMGMPVWEQEGLGRNATPSTADDDVVAVTVTTTPLYGPGKQQEDLIETVLLRNANYPGHWEASKDSLWAALPAPQEAAPVIKTTTTGDAGWLSQLRDSIASALPPEKTAGTAAEEGKEDKKPKEKDAAVSSFFESLLKDS
jgi:hypothetical protein